MKSVKKKMKAQLLEGLEDRRLMASFAVINTGDSGAGSLRQAILNANAAPGADTITFNISAALKRIDSVTDLPTITGPTIFDGTSQPGYAGTPLVNITGFAGTNNNGLNFGAGSTGSQVKGLQLSGFRRATSGDETKGNAITIDSGVLGVQVLNNTIGGPAGTHGNGIVVRGTTNIIRGNVIWGAGQAGIRLEGTGATNNGIYANSNESLGNGKYGVLITDGASNNQIGGTEVADRNFITGNDQAGIKIDSSDPTKIPSGNKILGNWIGIQSNGSASGNTNGIDITVGNNTQVGGVATGETNVISHSSLGNIRLSGTLSTNTTIRGNFIGMKADGTTLGTPITDAGIAMGDHATAVIGGNTAAARNYITGGDSSAKGIALGTESSAVIQNNVIGMNAAGAAVGVLGSGISLDAAADGMTIGGAGANEGNFIANAAYMIQTGETNNTFIYGNQLGFNLAGAAAGGVAGTGISLNTGSAIIGGTNPGERNYVTGNNNANSYGISVVDGMASVKNNYVGFNAAGSPTGTLRDGIYVAVTAAGVTIGGDAPGEGNFVTNAVSMIAINDAYSGTTIVGNQLGLNIAGTALAGTSSFGIAISTSSNITIRNNTIASASGSAIAGDFAGVIRGNRLGLTADGLTPLALANGINLNGSGVTIGGTTLADANFIGRCSATAINLGDGGNNIVQGNRIGMNVNGVPSGAGKVGTGIRVSTSSNNQIGGTAAGAGNVVVNAVRGLDVGSAIGTRIEGNTFGQPGATVSIGAFFAETPNATFGGTSAAAGNVINASQVGVSLDSFAGNVMIRRNSISAPQAIDLGNDGLTANDALDADTGANTRQNFPILLSADSNSGTSTIVSGLLSTSPGTPVVVDYYSSDVASGAKTWLASQTLLTDAGGGVVLNATLPFVFGNQYITATATNLSNAPFGNTSELAPSVQIAGPIDNIPPVVANSSFEFETAQKVKLVFNEDLNASTVAANDLVMTNTMSNQSFVPSAVSYDVATRTARFGFATILPDGNYSYTLESNKVSDIAGNGNSAFGGSTHVLAGDLNRDKAVNFDDLLTLAQNYGTSGKTFSQGDSNYDGNVNFDDLLILAQRYGSSLFSASPIATGSSTRSRPVQVID